MRTAHVISAALTALGVAAAAAPGCFDYQSDCERAANCRPGAGGGSSSSTTSSSATGGTGGNPACAGDPTKDPTLVRDECGVFVQADASASGDGSKAKPQAKLVDAIAQAQSTGKRVYACAGAPFVEAVTISAGVEMFGGFDCAKGWAWSKGARAVLNGPADAIALTIGKSADGAKVDGFAITAASPSNMKGGGSSIAIAVDDVTATIERCDVKASDAADGADGQTPTDVVVEGANAPPADALTMNACVLPAAVAGGAPGVTTCDDGDTSGGKGGKGGVTGTSNGDGEKGADGLPIDPVEGLGGGGESATKCAIGGVGKDGDVGAAGPGGSATGDVLSVSGISNSDATDGKPGTKAQGGGGGGGAKSGMFCGGGVDGPGASGGGGGAGGCGGKGGGGGKAGGSSIAILALGTSLTLVDVTIAVGKAGKGGSGVSGQNGGGPGFGAPGGAASPTPPSKAGCKGGDGGAGGPGGSGGGGRGGHAIGIAFAKASSAAPMIKSFTPGTPGDGGMGGTGAPMTSNGTLGNAGQCWNFAGNVACK